MNAKLMNLARARYAHCLALFEPWDALMNEAIAHDNDAAFCRALNGSSRWQHMLVALEMMYGEGVRV